MSWYVLVERGRYGESELSSKIPVEGGREAAVTRAEEVARSCTPAMHLSGTPIGRMVFQTSPTSWFVELTKSLWSKSDREPATIVEHVTVRAAELVHFQELIPAEPPKKSHFGR
ncbi:hypothetical protein [Streptomyces sp. st170]|uniref:hypothetical protein n=1 Tax=Streptomyces sp. st170 TaxID=1828058 RepID=UPI001180937A|nr:hypothetical protein [Streptomyces sp. st170]